MVEDPTPFSIPHLSTTWMGKPAFLFKEVDSTQDVLKKMLKENFPPGTLVMADAQRKGRGRLGKTWLSLPGSQLLFSLLLIPNLPSQKVSILTIAAAVAWAIVLEKEGLSSVQIKWPNDLMVQKKKIAGILGESLPLFQKSNPAIILGIGLNIDINPFDFPEEIRSSSTWTRTHGCTTERMELLKKFLEEFEALYSKIHQSGSEEIQNFFRTHWIFSGQPIEVISHQTFQGHSWEIDSDGALLLHPYHQKPVRILQGSVRLLSKDG